jgi:flagellar biosynthesis activator protein FlaF
MTISGYQQATKRDRAADPREAELQLFGQVTNALKAVQKSGDRGQELIKALDWNRRMWSVLSTDCGVEGNALPDKLRAGIMSLSIWVSKHSSQVMRGTEDVGPLIHINKTVMEGLAMRPKAPARPAEPLAASTDSQHPPTAPGRVNREA